ncbi:hypothetical protein [Pseudomonas typographi]|uniref:Ead/Ea22-like family protein n=1 Tax=Pseudomonas typographi TaxID=2715964 RepID=A0ABR7Z937_9PSED|nr:hypothetical protein [Pseudomonas typographi]MBD1601964.1 hypothetical protein [Pseudomonas typographi]
MTIDYAELKRLAEAANAEYPLAPWAYEPHGDTGTYGVGVLQNERELCVLGRQEPGEMLVVEPVATDVLKEKYAAFIASCSPGVVLGLLSALESKSGFLDDFIHSHKSLVSQRDQLRAENEGLRRENKSLRGSCEALGKDYKQAKRERNAAIRERDQFRAEVEALRKDAERYRWMRDIAPRFLVETPLIAVCTEDGSVRYLDHGSEMLLSGADADSAIDAAMSKEAGHG